MFLNEKSMFHAFVSWSSATFCTSYNLSKNLSILNHCCMRRNIIESLIIEKRNHLQLLIKCLSQIFFFLIFCLQSQRYIPQATEKKDLQLENSYHTPMPCYYQCGRAHTE